MYIVKNKWENPALEETLFHVANGYLGMRANVEGAKENYCRGLYINGFYDESDIQYGEKFIGFPEVKQSVCKLADVQTIQLYIDGKEVEVAPHTCRDYYHKLDMEKGYAERYFLVAQDGREIAIKTRRLASFHTRELAMIEYSVTARNFSGDIRLLSTLNGDVANFSASDDPRLAAQAEKPLSVTSCDAADGKLSLRMQTKRSRLDFACEVHHVQQGLRETYSHNAVCATLELEGHIAQGETYTLHKMIVVKDSFHFENIDILTKLESPAFYFAQQEAFLTKFWAKSRILLKGSEDTQNALDYSIYSLLGSVGFDDRFSVSAKGLSGEGYEGHVFWDSEVYVAPLFISTNPAIAKHMISYRHTILEFAKEQAKKLGHKQGALYAWRSIEGAECSAYFPSGSAQYHINGDIVYALMQYFFATYDVDFLEQKGFDILLETARLWLDAGHFTERGFCIDAVTGPDEYTCVVNNNFYTNVGAQHNLRYLLYAVDVLKKENRMAKLSLTSEKELADVAEAADKMYLPYDRYMNLNPQDDSFLQKKRLDLSEIPKENFPLLLHYHPLFLYRHQVCKQADVVLAHALYNDCANMETKRNSFHYYERICTHDSSLSLCAYAIMAAQLGLTKIAEKYFKETVDLDINNTHKNTKDGIHTANMGGSFLVMSKGFACIYMSEKGLSVAPNRTKDIAGYTFHIEYLSRVIEIDADRENCRLTLVEGAPFTLSVYGEEKQLETELRFAIR